MVSGFLQETFSLEGRVALCTGASSGIGRRMAGALARAGAAVVLVARRLDRLREAQAEIAEAGGKADCLEADLSTPAAADDVVARIEEPLDAMGNIYRTGPVGSGHAAKALNNFLSAASLTAASEALIVAQKFGLDGAKVADIWNASTGRSSATETKLHQHILNEKFAAGFTMKLLEKDVKIAKSLAESLDVRADHLDRISGLLGEALEELGDEADHTTLFKLLKRRAEEGRGE